VRNSRVLIAALVFVVFQTLSFWSQAADRDQNINSGKIAESVGNWQKAEQYYRKAHNNGEAGDAGTIAFVRALIETGKVDEAQDVLKEFLSENNPLNGEAHLLMADVQIRKDQIDKALISIQTGENLTPNSPRVPELRGLAYFKSGKAKESLELLSQALKTNNDWRLRLSRAQAYLSLKDFASAEGDLERVTQDRPQYQEAYFMLTDCYIERKKWAEAEKTLKHLLKVNAKDTRAMVRLTDVYGGQGKHEPQIEQLKQMIALEPSNPVYSEKLADAYAKQGSWKLAEDEYRRHIRLDPSSSASARKLVGHLNANKRFDQLGAFLKGYTQERPQEAWAASQYAQLLVRFNQIGFAESVLGKSQFFKKSDVNYFLIQGYLKFKAGDLKKSEDLMDKGAKAFPEDSRLRFNLALVLEAAGDQERAIQVYRTLLGTEDPLTTKAKVNLAFAYETVGNVSEASEMLRSIPKGDELHSAAQSRASELDRGVKRDVATDKKSTTGLKKFEDMELPQ
jgi:tetratricopeptide (TPR) repeat protein